MSQSDFDGIICEIFERLNSGKPLTDNDKYWNRKEAPAMQLLTRLKGSSEFGPLIRKYMWLNLGGGKGRGGLNHFIGLILGLIMFCQRDLTDWIIEHDRFNQSLLV